MPHWSLWFSCQLVWWELASIQSFVFTTSRLLITCLSGRRYLNALGVKPFSRGSVSRHLTLAETGHPLTEIVGVTLFWCQKSYPSYWYKYSVPSLMCRHLYFHLFLFAPEREGGGTQAPAWAKTHRWIPPRQTSGAWLAHKPPSHALYHRSSVVWNGMTLMGTFQEMF